MTAAQPRRLDHLVLPSRDLEAQAEFWRRLGFQVGARNVHPWGTQNRLIQFDGSFLELITLGDSATPPDHAPRAFSFGAHVRDFLAREEAGLSMLVKDTDDALADALWHRQAGIGDYEPFHFGRKAKRADGGDTEVAFTLAFASAESMPMLSFFACQNHFPENFWQTELQRHENGVTAISEVLIIADEPSWSLGFAKAFFGGEVAFDADRGLTACLGPTRIFVATPAEAAARVGDDPVLLLGRESHFGAVTFAVADMATLAGRLESEEVPFHRHGERIVVPSGAGPGVVLAFEERRS
jgi:catechol 2,3-dioxygenase-like lactoylglutathione lyase family enzyme